MGYHIRRGLVEDHEPVLSLIQAAIDQGESIHFPIAHPGLMEKTYYKFLRVIKATQRLPEECGGRFTHLRSRVIISQSWDQPFGILIKPAVSLNVLNAMTPTKPDERDALSLLQSFGGDTTPVSFSPSSSFHEPAFIAAVVRSGFTLATSKDGSIAVLREDDSLTYVAERIKEVSAFDNLDL